VLTNNKLRAKKMMQFLTAKNFDTSGFTISSIEGLFSFKFDETAKAEQFASQINALVGDEGSNSVIGSITLASILDKELQEATCADKKQEAFHLSACKEILRIIKTTHAEFIFSDELGQLEVTLPNPAYGVLLKLLTYPNMQFTEEGKLVINIRNHITATHSVVRLDGLDAQQAPLIFLNAKALEAKKMFYVTNELASGKIEVKPFFFVPAQLQPPKYHFVIDLSSSMANELNALRSNIKKLSKALFQIQPAAQIRITTFNRQIKELGTFSANEYENMITAVDGMSTVGKTVLYKATLKAIEQALESAGQTNVLIFTDCENKADDGAEAELKALIAKIGSEPSHDSIRTKILVLSCKVQQSKLMQSVAKTFHSEIIVVDNSDILGTDDEAVIEWSASRRLFVPHVLVTNNSGKNESHQALLALEQSGQLEELPTEICEPGDTVSVTIKDGEGEIVKESTITVSAAKPNQAYLDQRRSDVDAILAIGISKTKQSETITSSGTALTNNGPN